MKVDFSKMINTKDFNVIIYNYNLKSFESCNIIPYLVRCYNDLPKSNRPKGYEDLKNFVKSQSMHQFWARCEYEIILQNWPGQDIEKKIDVYDQILMNLDVVTEIFINNIKQY